MTGTEFKSFSVIAMKDVWTKFLRATGAFKMACAGNVAITFAFATLPIIGTYRDVELDVTRPFASTLESWIREKVATRVALRRFALPGVHAMLTALSGKKPPDSLATVVFTAST